MISSAEIDDLSVDMLMPEITDSWELSVIKLFIDAGKCVAGFDGPVRLPATELSAWASGTHRQITGVDFDLVIKLSAAYCDGFHCDEAPHEPTTAKLMLATAKINEQMRA